MVTTAPAAPSTTITRRRSARGERFLARTGSDQLRLVVAVGQLSGQGRAPAASDMAGYPAEVVGQLGGGLIAVDRAPRQCDVEYLLSPAGKCRSGRHLDQIRRVA